MKQVIRLGMWTAAVWLACVTMAHAQGRGTIAGTVVAPDGRPQGNITIVVTNAAGVDRRGVSEPDGSYVFGGLLAGPYRLRVDDDSGAFAPWSQDSVAVTGGQTTTIRIALQPRVAAAAAPTARATLAGTVIGPDGKPRGNVPVVVTNIASGAEQRVVSLASGAYQVGNLQAGNYRVRVQESFALPYASADLPLAPGEQLALDIRLQPPLRLMAPFTVPETTFATEEFQALPNRWDFKFPEMKRYQPPQDAPWVVGSPLDPYNQNRLKGDYPLSDNNLFLNVNLQANSALNPRVVAKDGTRSELFLNNNFVSGIELFSGTTVFEPKRWAVRATVVSNLNRLKVEDGKPTQLKKLGVEELFGEKRLAVMRPTFDFVTIRGGMQNFNSDFRGYLFVDNQMGVRLFGNARANRDQFNVAFFSMRTRDVVTQLHDFTSRNQTVFIANYYIQDFVAPGYTGMVNFHLNDDKGPEEDPFPLKVAYVGYHGDGRWGPWSVSHAYYEAFGTDDNNRIGSSLNGNAPAPVDIRARMAAVELARDANWLRYRFSFFYASGDDRSDPTKAGGFDMITDNPNLAGGQFMFWTQQTANLPKLQAGELVLSEKFSLLPNLRSKFTDRANFVNPGLMLFGGGADMRLSPKLKVVTNVSSLSFANNAVLAALVGPDAGYEDKAIGLDVSVGAKWRPFLNENLFLVPGFSLLAAQGGYKTAIGGKSTLNSFFVTFQVAY